jgi:hypothetical protein
METTASGWSGAGREIDAGKLRRCIAGGAEASSASLTLRATGWPTPPSARSLLSCPSHSAGRASRGGTRAGLWSTRDAATQLACVDLSLLAPAMGGRSGVPASASFLGRSPNVLFIEGTIALPALLPDAKC